MLRVGLDSRQVSLGQLLNLSLTKLVVGHPFDTVKVGSFERRNVETVLTKDETCVDDPEVVQ